MQLVDADKELPGPSYLSEKSPDRKIPSDQSSEKKLLDAAGDDKDSDDDSPESHPNQLILYKPGAIDRGLEIEHLPDSADYHISFQKSSVPKHSSSSRGLLSIGTFTVQCSRCMQWRIIPTKEKYEKIRESILQDPFYCETAQEWRPDVSCADPPDISQDGSRLWAIDKPNIAQAPPGWERLLRIRAEGGTRFADVYYVSPSGKRLRSMVEVQKYLFDNPEYASQGVSVSQFSFQTPKPLQENYVRKRALRLTDDVDSGANLKDTGLLDPEEVTPLSWARPLPCTDLQLNMSEQSRTIDEPPAYHSLFEQPPAKKMAVRRPPQTVGDE